MNRELTIETGSRLHFGPLSFRPSSGRHFGGVGMMIDSPGVLVEMSFTDEPLNVVGSERGEQFLKQICESFEGDIPHGTITVRREIPPHHGLGSGTQLGLAIAEAVRTLAGRNAVDSAELALMVGRGKRSAIGIHGYQDGGFLIDAGQHEEDSIGALAYRCDYPFEWPILLVCPVSEPGIHGAQEQQLFAEMPAMSEVMTGQLSRQVLTEILPALHARDFESWARSMTQFGTVVGEFFSDSQGGIFASVTVNDIVHDILKGKLYKQPLGWAQSSWGPTLAVLCPSAEVADSVSQSIQERYSESEVTVMRTTARNRKRKM